MANIGEMRFLTIGDKTYSLPAGGGGTVTSVGVSNATNGGLTISGSPITSSGSITIGHSNVLTSAQTTQAVYPIKIDKNGHISAYGSAVTIPTKVSDLTNDSGFVTTDEKLKTSSFSSSGNSTYLLGGPASTTADTKYYIPGLKFSLGTSLNILEVGTGNNSEGQINFGNNGATGTQTILKTSATAGKTITLPANTGTLALTSDIPTKTSDLTNDSGFITSYTDEKLAISAITSGATYYPIVAANSTAAATRQYDNDGFEYYGANGVSGEFNTGQSRLTLGNNKTSGTSKWKRGILRLYGTSANYFDLKSADGGPSANRTLTLPDASGTVALMSDIPTKVSDLTNDSGFVTTDEKLAVAQVSNSFTYYPIFGGSGATAATRLYDINFEYTSMDSTVRMALGSSSKTGKLRLTKGDYYTDLYPFTLTANRDIYLPNKDGILAVTSDITDEKLKITEVSDTNSYYPILGASGSTATTRLYDTSFWFQDASNTISIKLGSLNTKKGEISLFNGSYGTLKATTITSAKSWTFPDVSGTVALTSDIPSSAASSTTGVSISNHSTGSVTGVQSSTTTASKVTLGTAISVPNVTAAGSGSFTQGSFSGGSLTFAIDSTDSKQLNITFTAATHGADSHTHTPPTLGTAKSIPNVTAVSDVTVPIKDTAATTVVTSATHTVTDNGHTHSLS